jgi:hypothetical protein
MDTSSSSDNSDKLAANAHRTQIGDGSIKQAVNAHRAQMSDGSTTGSTDMTGGKSRRRSRSRSASRSASRSRGRARSASRSRGRGKSASRGRRARRAGMGCSKKGGSYGALVKEAIVPFGIFAWQKKSQRKKGSKKTFRKNRKSRRYKR